MPRGRTSKSCGTAAKLIPHPIFDTQVAAMVLGYGDSISYDQLVQRITGDALDKSHRFTDWTRRPLSDAQLAYAISDVTHLRDVYLALSADLGRRGRTEWVREEMEVLTSPETYRMEPEQAWERLKTRVRKPKELAVLIEVAAWREREAQARDVPRGRVLKDEVDRRHRRPCADDAGEARRAALAAARLRAVAMGRGHPRGGRARAGARSEERCRACRGRTQAANGAAMVELLKVLLRMTSEQPRRRRQGDRHRRRPRPHRRRRRGRRARAARLAPRAVRREGARAQARPARARGRARQGRRRWSAISATHRSRVGERESVGGISSFSAFAVFRSMTCSNLVGCNTADRMAFRP